MMSLKRQERLREHRRKKYYAQLRNRHQTKTERQAELNKLNEDHPIVKAALRIEPSRVGWCWRGKRLAGVEVTRPIDLYKFKNSKLLIAWMEQQPWWDQPVPDRDGVTTWHNVFSVLCGRLAAGEISERDFSKALVEMAVTA